MASTFVVMGLLVLVLFILCKQSNPGYLKENKGQVDEKDMVSMLQQYKAMDICFECKVKYW
jgi:hypothetical protein